MGYLEAKLPKKKDDATEYNEILLRRHAGALGLSSLIQAFPYEIPDKWMVECLIKLASCISDPGIIQVGDALYFFNQ